MATAELLNPSALTATASQNPRRGLMLGGLAVFAVLSVFSFAAIMWATGGQFSYSLDDPYIHLSMAEQILHGGYGVNPGEPASASSSVLFPYLDALGLLLGLGQFAALVPNLIAGGVAVLLLGWLMWEGGLIRQETPLWAGSATLGVLVICLNLLGLVFGGMEHGLHVALTLGAFCAVVRLERSGKGAWTLAVLIALATLVRFEGAAMLGAGVLVLLIRRRFAPAVTALVVAIAGLAGFAFYLHSLGLPWLPSSVLAKANDGAHGLGAQFRSNSQTRESLLLIAMMLPALGLLFGPRAAQRPRLAILFAVAVMAAHLLVGPFGWWHRYEAYVLVLGVGLTLLLWGAALRQWLAEGGAMRQALAVIFMVLAFQPLVTTTLTIPISARNIHLQQQQMRRFVVDYLRAPVAVNDLGWVSWRNEAVVLDLWGLASEEARRARQQNDGVAADPEWMDHLARRHHVMVAMIFDAWLQAPKSWTKLGELRQPASKSQLPVSFYAVDPRDVPEIEHAIAEWAAGLPPRSVFLSGASLPPAIRQTAGPAGQN